MPPADAPRPRLRQGLRASAHLDARSLWGGGSCDLALSAIAHGTVLGGDLGRLAGRSVLVRTHDAFAAALALIELDGIARRIVLCPPDLRDMDLPHVIATAGVEVAVQDQAGPATQGLPCVVQAEAPTPFDAPPEPQCDTEWLMFTSGTSGAPKMVVHSLAGLTGAIQTTGAGDPSIVWGTFYDIRRYGGLQILLRALLGEGSMVLPRADEPMAAFLARLARHGVTHLSGTPSHWRAALMTPAIGALAPRYIRLSGEIADQAVLDSLKTAFPGVPVGHAFASTEAGVGFEVNDGLEGFPAALLDQPAGAVAIKVVDGALRLRSSRMASGYAGADAPALAGADGFVDTGDMVERRGDRYYFVGRRNGVINVGGLKVHPEEVEAVINSHPAVRLSRVQGRRNPITGAIVTAEVVLADPAPLDPATLKTAILDHCRQTLAPFKTPASLRFVPALAMTAGGKLERVHA